jgi:competence protein ComEC
VAWEWRKRLVGGLYACLDSRSAGLVAGVVFGDKKGISHREIETYAKSGLSYLLAVAGLHLGIALALFLALVRLLTHSRRRQAALALALVLAYAVVTGLQVPVLRAGTLFVLVLIARIADLETDFLTSLAAGALLILLWQPGALWEAGFQFSFAVTLCVVYFSRPLALWLGREYSPEARGFTSQGLKNRIFEFLGIVLAVQLATIPLEAWHFSQFTYSVLFSNLLAMPLLPLLIGFGLACAVLAAVWPPLAWPFAKILWLLVTALRAGTGFFSSLPLSAISIGQPSGRWMGAWLVFVCALAAYLYYYKSLLPRDALGLGPRKPAGPRLPVFLGLAVLALFFWLFLPALPFSHRHLGVTKVWFLDVGQGDCILLEFEDGKTLLVDGGPGRPDAGSWVVQPALRSSAISSLDFVLMTHPDADHIGGLEWVFEQIPVGLVLDRRAGEIQADPEAEVWDGSILKSVRGLMRARRMACALVAAEVPLPADLRSRARVLWPPKGWKEASRKARNNSSVVMDVGGWLLLAGDLEKGGEKSLLKSGAIQHPYAILKLGHHGSRGASGKEFLQKVAPMAVVIQAGRANRFGFPHKEVLATLSHLKQKPLLFRTDLQGCLSFEKEPDGVMGVPFKTAEPALLWQAPPKPPRSIWKPLEKAGLVEAVKK